MPFYFPFGQELHPLIQEDKSPKKIFVLGVYASAVHAKWKQGSKTVSQALAVASEPRIFWDGNKEEAWDIIRRIDIPKELGTLEPASSRLNGPSAKVLDEDILGALGYTRGEAWLCDMLPETRLNPNQVKVIKERYDPLIEKYGLNQVTVPVRPSVFCDDKRAAEITAELIESGADTVVLLGDLPIRQYLDRISDVPFKTLQEYVDLYGYGCPAEVIAAGKKIRVIPLAHPRQIGALGAHSERWCNMHREWKSKTKK